MGILSYNRAAWDRCVEPGNRWTVPVGSDEVAAARAGQWSIVLPCSNAFVPEVRRVYREAFRVLRLGGTMLSGFCDPIVFAIDRDLEKQGIAQLKYAIPYSDVTSQNDEDRRRYTDGGEPLSFGHALEDLIGGQTKAGFVITGFYGDKQVDEDLGSRFMPCNYATRAVKVP